MFLNRDLKDGGLFTGIHTPGWPIHTPVNVRVSLAVGRSLV